MSRKRTAISIAKQGRKAASHDGRRRQPWETPFRLMRQGMTDKLAAEGAIVYYHLRHSCGHAVYWTNPLDGFKCSFWPCPWCGAIDGPVIPPGHDVLANKDGSFISREKPVYHPTGGPVVIQHMYNEYCCTGRGDPWGTGEAVHLE